MSVKIIESNDPKYNLINATIKYVFSCETERLDKIAQGLVRENAQLGGSRDGFYVDGKFFTAGERTIGRKLRCGRLEPQMTEAFASYKADADKIAKDTSLVWMALAIVLDGTETAQDRRDALPDLLAHLSGKHLTRTRPEAYTLEGDEAGMARYLKLKDTLSFYLGLKLLY